MSGDEGAVSSVPLEFRLLGPLEALRDGVSLELGPPKQRAVLATLLLAEGRVVSADRLIESVWGDDPPSRALANLQVYISKLRSVLDAEGARGIARRAPGYVLTADWVDVTEFRRLTRAAVAGAAAEEWAEVVAAADAAVGLWRGPFLDDLGDEEWVHTDAVQLDELYAECMEAWVTGLLGLNRVGEAVTRTQTMVEAYPLREHGWWLRMLALHRAGRSPEALDACQAFTGDLDEQLGLEPGPQMRELQTAILRHDEAIATWPNTGRDAPPTAPAVVPAAPSAAEPPDLPTPAGPARSSAEPARGEATPSAVDADGSGEPTRWPDQWPPIVGRVEELAVIDQSLVDIVEDRYRLVLLTGRAGMGKTRLAIEATLRAPDHGVRAIWTGCPDDAGTPAWWPLRALVSALGRDPDEIFVPPEGVDADAVRFTVYERLSRLLTEAAAEQPVLIVIDDAQWLDASSVRALAYLGQTAWLPNVGLILTVRDSERRPDFDAMLAAVSREDHTAHLRIEPLDGPSSSALLRQVSGDSVTPADAFALITRLGGNPLLLTEYARLPEDERRNGEIPIATRGLLERRLRRLPEGVLSVLGAAGVIGETFELDLLATVTGLDLLELVDRLDVAASEALIDPADSGAGYEFRHGLMRDAIVAQLSVLRRQSIHARVAQALADHGRDSRTLIRRARHVSAAMPVLGPAAVVEASSDAARAAEEAWDWDAAATQWRTALGALDVVPDADPDTRDLLLIAQLSALSRAGRAQTVLDTVDAALGRAEALDQTTTIGRLAAVLLRTAGAWPWSAFGADSSALLARLGRLEPLVAHDSAAHARVLAALAVGNCYHPDVQVPEVQSVKALEIAERLGDPDVLADALIGRSLAFSGVASRAADLIELLARLRDLPHFARETDEVLRHNLLTMATFSLGDMATGAEHLRAGIEGSDRQRLPLTRVQLRWAEVREAQWRGDFPLSDQLISIAENRHQQTELYAAVVTAQTARMAMLADLGRLAATPMLEGLHDPRVWTALEAAERGDHVAGREAIESWLVEPDPDYWYALGDRTWFAHATADLGLADLAPELIRRLAPDREHIAARGQTASIGPVALATGKLHVVLGDVEEARADLELAVRLCREGGGAPDLLRARLALLQLDPPGPERASALNELAVEADALHMVVLAKAMRDLADA